MGGIHFDPNAGGAQGPRETIAGHTFDARQSAAIHHYEKKLEDFAAARDDAIRHTPNRASQLHDELQEFVDTELQRGLKSAGLTSKEIEDVLKHFEKTTGYKGVPDGMMKPGTNDIPGLNHTQSAAVHRLAEALQNKFNDIKGRMDDSPSIRTADGIYLENRDDFHDMVKPKVIEQQLAIWDEFNPSELKVAVNQLNMQWERLDYELRWGVARITPDDIRFK
jgi:hypothetical protein